MNHTQPAVRGVQGDIHRSVAKMQVRSDFVYTIGDGFAQKYGTESYRFGVAESDGKFGFFEEWIASGEVTGSEPEGFYCQAIGV